MDLEEFLATYKNKQGSQYIATHKFLAVLSQHLDGGNGIVDFGAGIGTISAWAKENNPNLEVLAIEPSEWCRGQFLLNLDKFDGIELIESLGDADLDNRRGWVWVIDMAFENGDQKRILDSKPKVILVEGHRYHQRASLLNQILQLELNYDYFSFGGDKFSEKGGCYFVPGKRKAVRLVAQLSQVAAMHLLMRLLTLAVRMVNFMGFGKGASKKS
jgi:hypothetical protein